MSRFFLYTSIPMSQPHDCIISPNLLDLGTTTKVGLRFNKPKDFFEMWRSVIMSMYCNRCAFFNSTHLVHNSLGWTFFLIFLSTFSKIEFLKLFFFWKGNFGLLGTMKRVAFYNHTFSCFSFWKITPPPFCTWQIMKTTVEIR